MVSPFRRPAAPPPLLLAGLMTLWLSACEEGKPRHPPPDPMAMAPPPVEETPLPPARSGGLTRRPQLAGFFLERAGAALDPYNNPRALTPRDRPLVFEGFGFDPLTKTPARGVDVIIDGKPYGATYGLPRGEVAARVHVPALVNVGFRTVLPSATLAAGAHTVTLRVISADGSAYYEAPKFSLYVQ